MERKLKRQLKEIDERIRDLGSQKKRILGIRDEAITAVTAAPIFVRLPEARRRMMAQVCRLRSLIFARLDALRKALVRELAEDAHLMSQRDELEFSREARRRSRKPSMETTWKES
jgi:hypothetical protein